MSENHKKVYVVLNYFKNQKLLVLGDVLKENNMNDVLKENNKMQEETENCKSFVSEII